MFCSTNVAEDFNKRIFASEETEEEKVFILKEVRCACVLIYNLFYQITGIFGHVLRPLFIFGYKGQRNLQFIFR